MATLREIKLFCKRNKTLLFCTYVAIIYVFLNVFIAENNVSLLRYQKSGQPEEEEEDDVRVKVKEESPENGGREDKRNNILALRFMDARYKFGKDSEALRNWEIAHGMGDLKPEVDKENHEVKVNMIDDGDVNIEPPKKIPGNGGAGGKGGAGAGGGGDGVGGVGTGGGRERVKAVDDADDVDADEWVPSDPFAIDGDSKEQGGKKQGALGFIRKDRKIVRRNKSANRRNKNKIKSRGRMSDGGVDKKVNVESDEVEKFDEKHDNKKIEKEKTAVRNSEVDNKDGNIGGGKQNPPNANRNDMNINKNAELEKEKKMNDEEGHNAGDKIHDQNKKKENEEKMDKDKVNDQKKETEKVKDEKRETEKVKDEKKETEKAKDEKKETEKVKDEKKETEKVKDEKKETEKVKDEKKDVEKGKIDAKEDNEKGKDEKKDAEPMDKTKVENVEESKTALGAVMAQLKKDKEDTKEFDLTKVNMTEKDVYMPFYVEFGKEGDPGENATKYEYPEDNLSKLQLDKKAMDYKKNYFDLWVSNKIALHRSLNDARTPQCKEQTYDVSTFPPVSIIVVYYNEAWTTLLRTVHSILDRTPKSVLLEIILLDDFSTDDHLKAPLEIYLKKIEKVRLIRATKRLGLIKARNIGFLYAKGEIILFLDSHIECFEGWIEPLIAPIVADPKVVTFPIIDVIDKDNFGLQILPGSNIGTFDFTGLTFIWERSDEKKLLYYKSPTMPGGLYAISKKWFQHLGAYDPGLQLWGGENLEISFKIWMCGGRLLASACSNVGHVFRSMSPNHGPALSRAIKTNAWRLAEVWLDQYKHLYYEKFNYRVDDFGDVTNQLALRKSLECKSFDWYLTEINPKLKKLIDPGGKYSGQVMNMGAGMCLQADPRNAMLRKCDMMHYKQMWQLSPSGYLTNQKQDLVVMEFVTRHRDTNTTSIMYGIKLHPITRHDRPHNAVFIYDKTMRLYHKDTDMCLDLADSGSKITTLSECNTLPTQKWILQTREELQAYHKKRKTPVHWNT